MTNVVFRICMSKQTTWYKKYLYLKVSCSTNLRLSTLNGILVDRMLWVADALMKYKQKWNYYTLRHFAPTCTRDSQKVRGHFYLLSHLLNIFKVHFIFKERCFHSLINANIKQITAIVPEKIDFEYAWDSRSGTRKIWDWRHQTLSRNWAEIQCIFIKTDNSRKSKTYVCI